MEKFTQNQGKNINILPTQYSWTGSLDEKDRALLSFAQKTLSESTKTLLALKFYERNLVKIKAFVSTQ